MRAQDPACCRANGMTPRPPGPHSHLSGISPMEMTTIPNPTSHSQQTHSRNLAPRAPASQHHLPRQRADSLPFSSEPLLTRQARVRKAANPAAALSENPSQLHPPCFMPPFPGSQTHTGLRGRPGEGTSLVQSKGSGAPRLGASLGSLTSSQVNLDKRGDSFGPQLSGL